MAVNSLITVLSSVGLSGLLLAVLIWLSKSWVTERLKRAVEHEYAHKLETHKSQLRAEHELALERIRIDNARELEVHSAAIRSFQMGHMAGQELRLAAIEALWGATLRLREQTPSVLVLTDLIERGQCNALLEGDTFVAALEELSHDRLMKVMHEASTGVEESRPFVGEPLWALYFAYRVIVGRIWIVLQEGRDKASIRAWQEDHGIHQVLDQVLNPEEAREFKAMNIGTFSWLRMCIESKILANMHAVISGEESGALGLQQARRIANAAQTLDLSPTPDAATPNTTRNR
jgi:hypothetical protein